MSSVPPSPNADRKTVWLRRADQAAIAALTAWALVAMAGYWWWQGGSSGLVELDRARPQPAEFWVDINEADWPELAQLPEVGENLARRIVDSREQRGLYSEHGDLRRVQGIGPKTLERIRPYLRPIPPGGDVAGKASKGKNAE
jgi:competence protein ComEA